jgi:hypothetical protein
VRIIENAMEISLLADGAPRKFQALVTDGTWTVFDSLRIIGKAEAPDGSAYEAVMAVIERHLAQAEAQS